MRETISPIKCPSRAVFSAAIVSDSVAPGAIAQQAPLSMGFSRQEYWSGLPFPPPGHLPDPEIEPASPALAGRFFTTSTNWEAHRNVKKDLLTFFKIFFKFFISWRLITLQYCSGFCHTLT